MTLTWQGQHKNAWFHNCMQQLVAHNWARGMIAANLYCYIPGSSFMSPRRLSQISESGIRKSMQLQLYLRWLECWNILVGERYSILSVCLGRKGSQAYSTILNTAEQPKHPHYCYQQRLSPAPVWILQILLPIRI